MKQAPEQCNSQPEISSMEKVTGGPFLTPAALKEFPGCEGYSEQQAAETAQSLHLLAGILLKLTPFDKIQNIDNQCFVYLNQHNKQAA